MKKVSKKAVAMAAVVVAVGALAVIICCLLIPENPYKDEIAGSFDVNDERYQEIIEGYAEIGKYVESQLDYLGPVDTAEKAKREAEKEWFKVYGKEHIIDERPYTAYYDAENKVWYVYGYLPPKYLGGTAEILIRQEDGKVLALWHGK